MIGNLGGLNDAVMGVGKEPHHPYGVISVLQHGLQGVASLKIYLDY